MAVREDLERVVPRMTGQESLEKIIFAHELERRRWALEIHDGIIQSLGNIYYRLQAYRKLLSGDAQQAPQELNKIEELVLEAITECRAIIDTLRPSILDDVGLVPAVEQYVDKIRQEDHVDVYLEVEGLARRLSPEIEATVYRILQEALLNARKHARATGIKVSIVRQHHRLLATVTDNGQGFSVAMVDAEGDNWGLIGMRERAEVIGGSLEIESTPGRGTEVRAEVPISQPQD